MSAEPQNETTIRVIMAFRHIILSHVEKALCDFVDACQEPGQPRVKIAEAVLRMTWEMRDAVEQATHDFLSGEWP